jgi:pimeloyl-ACP methyl ester carboxylesterase
MATWFHDLCCLHTLCAGRPAQVVALDQRFHGDSDSPPHGFHVSRLAADLQELLQHLDLSDVTAVGTSLGCAVIWSYLELFGPGRISKVSQQQLPCGGGAAAAIG